jgi:hypothetical protein
MPFCTASGSGLMPLSTGYLKTSLPEQSAERFFYLHRHCSDTSPAPPGIPAMVRLTHFGQYSSVQAPQAARIQGAHVSERIYGNHDSYPDFTIVVALVHG